MRSGPAKRVAVSASRGGKVFPEPQSTCFGKGPSTAAHSLAAVPICMGSPAAGGPMKLARLSDCRISGAHAEVFAHAEWTDKSDTRQNTIVRKRNLPPASEGLQSARPLAGY